MSFVDSNPKFKVIKLIEAQLDTIKTLEAEREELYKRWNTLRADIEKMYQDIAGKDMDWQRTTEEQYILVRNKKDWPA